MAEETTTWLSQSAYDHLQQELEQLETVGRAEIAKVIAEARSEGDLKENGGYHAAREEQGKQEARIRQLQHILRTAKVGEAPADDGTVSPGMQVKVLLSGKEKEFLLGSREAGSSTDLDVYSEQSPLGQAILGQSVGSKTSYTAPSGKEIKVEIKEAKPFVG